MTLEDLHLLKKKNQKRLKYALRSTFALGINVTAPSVFKDSLRIFTVVLITAGWVEVYGHVSYISRYRHSVIIMAESICTMLQTMISIFKLSYIIFVQRRFHRFLSVVQTHEMVDKIDLLSQETPYNAKLRKDAIKILDKCWRNALAQFNFYMVACISIISYYFFNAQAVNAYNWLKGNTNHTIMLPYPSVFPFWEEKMHHLPVYLTLTFVGGSSTFIAGIAALSFDGIFIILALHGVALLQILRKMIHFTTSPEVPKSLRVDYLRQCIDHYQRTFQYCTGVNNLYLHISLVQFILSLVILGVVMFQASVGMKSNKIIVVKMGMYMAAAGYEVVIYCLNGQLVCNEHENLLNAWYGCEWYNESLEFKQLIRMMIMRNNRTFQMRASWFSTMSLATLMGLIKTSGSYFLLLKNLAE